MNAAVIQVNCADDVPRSCWNRPLSTAGADMVSCTTHTPAATRVPVVSWARRQRGAGRGIVNCHQGDLTLSWCD